MYVQIKSAKMAPVHKLAVIAAIGVGFAVVQAHASTIVVTAANPQGWAFSNTDNSGTNASGQFVSGPALPPLGSGSAQLVVGGTTSSEILYSFLDAGTRLSDITTLAYSTYVATSTAGSGAAPALSFDIWYNGETSYSGRLVFDPGVLGTVTPNTWQTWDTETAAGWYFSRQPGSAVCQLNNGTYCTLAQVEAAFPNITINDVIFKAGSGQSSFNGNVDALQIGTERATTTVDFEGSVPEPASAGLLLAGIAAVAGLRRRKAIRPA